MSLALLGVRTKGDKRGAYLHQGNWAAKLAAWLVFIALPFFFPNGLVVAYGWAARFGSGLFLIIQMLILVDFTAAWNESWVAAGEDDDRWLYALLGLTVASYAGVLAIAGLLFAFFKPGGAGSCGLNVFLITFSLLLCVAFSMLSVLPCSRGGSLFPSAITSLYVMYLCYSALQSEPKDYACNGLAHRINAASGSTLVIGMLVTLLSVVYSALRAGELRCFRMRLDDDAPSVIRFESHRLPVKGQDSKSTRRRPRQGSCPGISVQAARTCISRLYRRRCPPPPPSSLSQRFLLLLHLLSQGPTLNSSLWRMTMTTLLPPAPAGPCLMRRLWAIALMVPHPQQCRQAALQVRTRPRPWTTTPLSATTTVSSTLSLRWLPCTSQC
jgi:hypothetical protein